MTVVNHPDYPLAHMTSGQPLVYYCLWCRRGIEPDQAANGNNVYVHDNVFHPDDATFDEDRRPQ